MGREVSRDVIGALRDKNMITAGPRSPTPGAPFTYVTTKGFLGYFGLDTLRDLPDLEAFEGAGLLVRSDEAPVELPATLTKQDRYNAHDVTGVEDDSRYG
ncbi:segregation and condensation protein B [Devosia sp. LC5]|nr:segregation and condensation protein B [Devosia sp. LC5]